MSGKFFISKTFTASKVEHNVKFSFLKAVKKRFVMCSKALQAASIGDAGFAFFRVDPDSGTSSS